MICLYCCKPTNITNSRKTSQGFEKWRRHHCYSCDNVFTTIESVNSETSLFVIKRSGKIEPFASSKVLISAYKALDHRADAQIMAEKLTKNISFKLLPAPTKKIPTSMIYEKVISTLKNFDPVSAVKYQSTQTPAMNKTDIRRVIK
jgi:transcriptional repressor NrdR